MCQCVIMCVDVCSFALSAVTQLGAGTDVSMFSERVFCNSDLWQDCLSSQLKMSVFYKVVSSR